MGALQDFLKKNIGSNYGGMAGKAFLANDVISITTADSKFKAILKTARDLALFRIVWPTALLGALSGLQTVFRHLVIDSGSLAAAIDRIKTISVYQNQFEPLLKGVAQAKQRVAELMTFAAKSPFSLPQVVQASRSLEIFTRGAMGAGDSLKLVQNIATASGTGIESAADAFGGLYRALENKEPISRVSDEIQRMGLLSTQTAEKIQRLQDTGASFAQVWLTVQEALKVNSKQTDDYNKSIEGLSKQLEEQQQKNKAVFAKSFVPAETQGVKLSLGTAQNLEPVMETLGNTMAGVTTIGENFSKWIVNLITSIPGLSTAIGIASKSFVMLAGGIGLLAAVKGVQGLYSFARTLVSVAPLLSKTTVAAKLASTSLTFLEKAATAAANGQNMLAKAYTLVGNVTGKAAAGVGGLTVSLRALAIAAATNPITWIAAAVAAAAGVWQLAEATNASSKALDDLSSANAEQLKSSRDMIRAIQTEDDAYAALAATTEAVTASRKKLKDLGPIEQPGFIERHSGPDDTFGIKMRREMRNKQIENEETKLKELQGRGTSISQKIASGLLAPNKEKQAVLEEAAARKVRLDQMERENRIQFATGHEKLRLMREEQSIEASKGRAGEGTAEARAEFEGKTKDIIARELNAEEKEKLIAEAARTAVVPGTGQPAEIIREEQRVQEMTPGKEQAAAALAIATKKKDIETDRTAHIERALGLEAAVREGELQERLADIRLTAEESIADLKSVGVERAKEEYAIKMATLDATMKTQIAAGRPEEARSTRAAMQAGRQEQFERTRGVETTRAQFQLELQQHSARREGRTQESQQLEDISAFLSHFEEFRTQFGEPEAGKMALAKRRDELVEEQGSQVGPVVASSLQSIGGGGGVYGVNGNSMQRVQERIRDLHQSSNTILQKIETNTKEKEVGTPAIPTVSTVTETAEAAQHANRSEDLAEALSERERKEPPKTGPTTVTSANIVVPGGAPTIPPAVSITNPSAIPAPAARTTAAPAAVPTPLPGPLSSRRGGAVGAAQIVVPGEAPAIPPSVTITNPPITAAPSEAVRGPKLEAIDLGGRALDYISLIAKNTGLSSAAARKGSQGIGATKTPETPEQRDAMVRKAHGIYGVPKFGLFPHDEAPTTEIEGPTPVTPGTSGRNFFASHTGDETVDRMLAAGVKDSSLNKPAGKQKVELDDLQTKSNGKPLTASLDALQKKSNNLVTGGQGAPYAPSPSGLQKALADREPEDPFASIGPNFHAIQVLRTLKDIHERHMEGNGHLDTIAGKEAGVS